MYKNQRILYSENEPENTPENEPENGPQMSFGTKNIFSSKILFNNEFQKTECMQDFEKRF